MLTSQHEVGNIVESLGDVLTNGHLVGDLENQRLIVQSFQFDNASSDLMEQPLKCYAQKLCLAAMASLITTNNRLHAPFSCQKMH